MRSSYSFLVREHRILERMHEIIQKGMDGLTQRLDNDLKDDDSRILVPIGYIKGLCDVGGMNLIDLCVLFAKIFELIRLRFKSNLFRSSLSFMGGVISGLNEEIRLYQKWK
ncbi:hypothetical protein HpHCM72_05480 [Helicobacter pylori]